MNLARSGNSKFLRYLAIGCCLLGAYFVANFAYELFRNSGASDRSVLFELLKGLGFLFLSWFFMRQSK